MSMSTQHRAARVAALSAVLTLSATSVINAAPASAEEPFEGTDWTGGYYVPEEEFPSDPGYATTWRSYDVIRFGDPRFFDYGADGVRVLGKFEGDRILCLSNAKAGMQSCEVEGQKVTEFQGLPKTITTDPTVAMLAPVVGIVLALGYRFSNLGLTGISGLSS